jgi:broad specificity phosphatase PhoE
MPRTTPRTATTLLLLLSLLLAGALHAQSQPQDQAQSQPTSTPGATTVVIVRHAEKADASRDTALSPAGQKRAEALAAALDGAEVGAVYVSQFRRTRLTAGPLLGRLGLAAQERPVGDDISASARELATEVLTRQAGKTVLVVGHSNTVPEIVKALSGLTVGPIGEPEFDHLFVVVVPPAGAGPARLFKARYGAPSGS